jgi:hypothetical protein
MCCILGPASYIYVHIFKISYHKNTHFLFRKYTPTLTEIAGTAYREWMSSLIAIQRFSANLKRNYFKFSLYEDITDAEVYILSLHAGCMHNQSNVQSTF